LVGQLYLKENDIPRAWMYFRMLGEAEPVARALEEYQFKEGDGSSHAVMLEMLEQMPASRILDLGCSGGLFAERARAAGHTVTGVDAIEVAGVRERTDRFYLADLEQERDEAAQHNNPELVSSLQDQYAVITDYLDPLAKQLGGDKDPSVQQGIDALKEAMTSMKDTSFGYVYPGGAQGESIVQVVGEVHGGLGQCQWQIAQCLGDLRGVGGGELRDTAAQQFDRFAAVKHVHRHRDGEILPDRVAGGN